MPRVVWLVTAVHFGLLFTHSLLLPPYQGPDEHAHVDSILGARQEFGYQEFDGKSLSAQVVRTRLATSPGEGRSLQEEDAVPRNLRPSYSEVARPLEIESGDETPNLVLNHPPLYYAAMAGASSFVSTLLPGGELPWDKSLGLLRLLNMALVGFLPVIVFLTARAIGAVDQVAVTAALFPLAIPMLTSIGGSVNNDNLIILLGGVVTLFLARVTVPGGLTVRNSASIGVSGGLALLTKGFALTIPMWIGLAYFTAAARLGERRLAARRGLQALGIAMLVGGWWWIRNRVMFGRFQTGVNVRPLAPESFLPDVGWWVGRYLTWLRDRFWGSFGSVDVDLPHGLIVGATVVTLVGLALAFVRRDASSGRIRLLLMLTPLLTIFGVVTAGAFGAYLRLGQPVGFHGRYLFPAVTGLSVVVASGLAGMFARRKWLMPLLMLAGAAIMQAIAAYTLLRWYWGDPVSPIRERLAALVAWAPWPGWVGPSVVVATALMGGWVVWELVSLHRRIPPRE